MARAFAGLRLLAEGAEGGGLDDRWSRTHGDGPRSHLDAPAFAFPDSGYLSTSRLVTAAAPMGACWHAVGGCAKAQVRFKSSLRAWLRQGTMKAQAASASHAFLLWYLPPLSTFCVCCHA